MTWKKGQSGNPHGRPKDPVRKGLRDMMRKLVILEDGSSPILMALADKAAEGDSQSIKIMLEYGWDRPNQQVKLNPSELTPEQLEAKAVEHLRTKGYSVKKTLKVA